MGICPYRPRTGLGSLCLPRAGGDRKPENSESPGDLDEARLGQDAEGAPLVDRGHERATLSEGGCSTSGIGAGEHVERIRDLEW